MSRPQPAPLAPAEVIRRRRRRLQNGRTVRGFLVKLALFAAFVYAVFGLIFGLTAMRGADMKPRFYPGDLLLFYRLERSYGVGEAVVYRRDGRQYVSRVVAVPGDSVEIRSEGGLVRNGVQVMEDDIFYATLPLEDVVAYPLALGPDEYFLLSDYRSGGKDSRYFGPIRLSEIEGKVMSALRRRDL